MGVSADFETINEEDEYDSDNSSNNDYPHDERKGDAGNGEGEVDGERQEGERGGRGGTKKAQGKGKVSNKKEERMMLTPGKTVLIMKGADNRLWSLARPEIELDERERRERERVEKHLNTYSERGLRTLLFGMKVSIILLFLLFFFSFSFFFFLFFFLEEQSPLSLRLFVAVSFFSTDPLFVSFSRYSFSFSLSLFLSFFLSLFFLFSFCFVSFRFFPLHRLTYSHFQRF